MTFYFDTIDQAASPSLEFNADTAWDFHICLQGRIWAVREPTIPELLDICNVKKVSTEVLLGIFHQSFSAWTGLPLAIAQSVDHGKLCEFLLLIGKLMAKRIDRKLVPVTKADAEAAASLHPGQLFN